MSLCIDLLCQMSPIETFVVHVTENDVNYAIVFNVVSTFIVMLILFIYCSFNVGYNRVTFCSYCVQFSSTLHEQLCTIVDNVMRLRLSKITSHKGKESLDVTITANITRKLESCKEAITILTDSDKNQVIDGYFCDTAVYPEIW